MKLIFEHNLDEIDTLESFFGEIVHVNNNLFIPFINLGVSNHELNPGEKLKHINYAYIVAEALLFLKFDRHIIINKPDHTYEERGSLYLGGSSLIPHQEIFEIELQARKVFLQITGDYQIRDKMWLPVNTPYFPQNMDPDIVDHFIHNKHLPQNIVW